MKVIHTADRKMLEVLKTAENVASSKASVLIYGESGCGKELLARFIHAKSNRSSKEFHAINCAALPDGLLESELFGYEKGAFTGADARKAGKFEIANYSTFLLDEISEMALPLQAKLLRVVQENEVMRLGGAKPIKVDTRLIATTNRRMDEMVQEKSFREDLFYRLNVIPLVIPPLRERLNDIELLSQFFIEVACVENGLEKKYLSSSALEKLKMWKWPGNIRELENVMQRTVLLTAGKEIKSNNIQIDNFEIPSDSEAYLKPGMTVSEAEKRLILKTLEYTGQNRTHAADLLGISIRTLRNKINEYKEEKAI